MSKKNPLNKNVKGFTLIEILLSIAIIGILATSTFVVFTRFNRQQNITIAQKNIMNDLAEAKANALSHVVYNCKSSDTDGASGPIVAGVLVGYQITFNTDTVTRLDTIPNNEYSLQEVCRHNVRGVMTDDPLPAVKTKKLPPDISFGTAAGVTSSFIRFNTLSGGATFPPTYTEGKLRIRNSSGTQIMDFEVNSAGIIKIAE